VGLLALGLVVTSAALAGAAGTVTNCATYGPGPGTLATALMGGGTVTFACSGTIIVPEIAITTDTEIDATGQTVALSGNNANRVLRVWRKRLDLINVAITHGKADKGSRSSSVAGGLAAFYYSTVTLANSTVSGNTAAYRGGGFYAWGASVMLMNSTVSGNSAGDRGGGL
jgi:hypothetical protein